MVLNGRQSSTSYQRVAIRVRGDAMGVQRPRPMGLMKKPWSMGW